MAGSGGEVKKAYRISNVEASPFRFVMDPRDLARVSTEVTDNGWDFLAVYCSRTNYEDPYPSDVDVRLWPNINAVWPACVLAIVPRMDVGNPVMRIFDMTEGVVNEEILEVVVN